MDIWYETPDWATNPTALLVLGLIGGSVIALLMIQLNRRAARKASAVVPHRGQVSIDMINMAHIRVVGAGGLGLVAMCAVVAFYIPPIGISLGTGFLLGTAGAIVMILKRRETGPISSSSQSPGANTTLKIDE
jgi:hypothetical protein